MKGAMRFLLPLGLFALLALLLAVGLHQAPGKGVIQSPLIGKPAPPLVLPRLDTGEPVDVNAAYQGRWYLLNVWGTWCVECRYEHPVLLQIAQQAALPLVGMDWRDDPVEAKRWLAELGDPYELNVVDLEGRAAISYGVYGAPETYLVNPQGIIVHKRVGALTPEVWRDDFLPLIRGERS
jgi:cytochrome c biogenesis protein CcmG, thiol:disulfide interchange protein DsbE